MLTKEQLLARKSSIGGSDVASILGLSPYKTAYQLYLEKTGMLDDTLEMTQPIFWGSRLEQVVREEFAQRNNVVVEMPQTLNHPVYPFMSANLDGFIPSQNGILEVKCASAFTADQWGNPGSDKIPMHYLVQVAHYCFVANAELAHICVLIGGNDYREYKYVRDKGLEQQLLQACVKFWACVQSETPPEPVNLEDLKLMFWKSTETKSMTAIPSVEIELGLLAQVREQIKSLQDKEEHHKFNIMKFMEDAEVLIDENGLPLVTWKTNKRGARSFLIKGDK